MKVNSRSVCSGSLSLIAAALFSLPSAFSEDVTSTATNNNSTDNAPSADCIKPTETCNNSKSGTPLRLHAEITNYLNPEFNKQIADLISFAHNKQQREQLLAKEKHYKKPTQKITFMTKDLAELCTAYRGFEQSSEAADVILEEKTKLKECGCRGVCKTTTGRQTARLRRDRDDADCSRSGNA